MIRRGWQTSRRGSTGQGGADGGSFVPTALPGLVLWLRADMGITLGSTPKATGTTPPAVTISGTPTGLSGLHIEITTGGTLGVALFKWSLDNGTTYQATNVATAASVVLGTSGITAAFPAGTYNVDNRYDGTVSQWNDQSGQGNHVANATSASQPVLLVGDVHGRPAAQFDGGDDYLNKANKALFSTDYSIVAAIKYDTIAASSIWFANAESGTTGVYARQLLTNRGVTHVAILDRSDGAAQTTTYEIVSILYSNGTPCVLRVNGADGSLQTVTSIVAPNPATAAVTLGARYAGGAVFDTNCACRIAELIVVPSKLSTANVRAVERYMGAEYGLPVT